MFSIGAFVLIAIIIMRFFGKVKRTQEMDVMKKVLKILGIVVLALVVVLAAFFAYAQYKNWKTLNTPILPDDGIQPLPGLLVNICQAAVQLAAQLQAGAKGLAVRPDVPQVPLTPQANRPFFFLR